MTQASRIFLSIRQGEPVANNEFSIKAGKRRPDENQNLYYKVLNADDKNSEKEISGLTRMVAYDTDAFVGTVKNELKNSGSKNILFFIHGYHPFKNVLHTHLLDELALNYSSEGNQGGFGCIIFFSWPNRGLQWREDDEAGVIGRVLARKFSGIFTGVRDLCRDEGGKFFLMCQSFGHQVLNSFVSNFHVTMPCFEKVFLLAADIPNQSLNEYPEIGVQVPNKIGFGGDYRLYNLTPLRFMSKEVHVFYDKCDVILTASKRNFLHDYERLGKTGPMFGTIPSAFIVHNYDEYKEGMFLGPEIKVKPVLPKIIIGKIQKKYNERHQYFYTNKKVVEIIREKIV